MSARPGTGLPRSQTLKTAYASAAGTAKHTALTFGDARNVQPTLEMLYMIAGSKDKFHERPFCHGGGCPVISPLRYGEDNSEVCIESIKFGAPVWIVVAPQAGATAPAALAGAVVQVMAEAIASFLMINLGAPKHPVIVGAGMMGSLMGLSFESLLIDNDMLGAVLRTVRGIEVNEETLSYAVIEDAVHGEGHLLRQEQTLKLMRSEYDYPKLADRLTPDEWEEAGSLDIRQQVGRRVKDILSSHYPMYIDPAADKKIRENFPICLQPEEMKPGNGRW